MAGIDTDILGEARPQTDIKIGYLAQEPELNPEKDVRGNVEEGLQEAIDALAGLDKVYADYAEPDADFDALAKEQARLEDILPPMLTTSTQNSIWLPMPCDCRHGRLMSVPCQAVSSDG